MPEHRKPDDDNAICWLLDVRAYGIETANAMHANDTSDIDVTTE